MTVASVSLPKVTIDGGSFRSVSADTVVTLTVSAAAALACAAAPAGPSNLSDPESTTPTAALLLTAGSSKQLSVVWSLLSTTALPGLTEPGCVVSLCV